jgi:hypothetical protein
MVRQWLFNQLHGRADVHASNHHVHLHGHYLRKGHHVHGLGQIPGALPHVGGPTEAIRVELRSLSPKE